MLPPVRRRTSAAVRTLVAALVAALCGALPLAAQAADTLSPGARLRVTALHPARVVLGSYRETTDTTLVLELRAAPVAIALREIARVELSRGRRASVAGGIGGFLVGAVLGGVIGCAANRDSYGVFCGGQDDTRVFLSAGLGGVVGGTAGALLPRRERWVSLEDERWGTARRRD